MPSLLPHSYVLSVSSSFNAPSITPSLLNHSYHYKNVCFLKIPLVPSSFPTALLLFYSFKSILSSLYPTLLSLRLRSCICQGHQLLPWSKLNGQFFVLASCELFGTQHWWQPFFLKHLSCLVFYLPGFPSLSLATPSQCHYLTPPPHSNLNFGLSLVLVWTEYSSFSLSPSVSWSFGAWQLFVVWYVLSLKDFELSGSSGT